MILSLLNKIAGLFEKDFLFASFLPALIFMAAVAATLTGVVGFEASWSWIDSWTALQKAVAAAGTGLAVIVFAYVLSVLRPVFLRFWSGTVDSWFLKPFLWPFFSLGKRFQRYRYDRLRQKENEPARWGKVQRDFRNLVNSRINDNRINDNLPGIPAKELNALKLEIKISLEDADLSRFERIAGKIANLYAKYNENSLTDLYKLVYGNLNDRVKYEEAPIREARRERDWKFGGMASIQATDLGNIIEAYKAYPYERYGIEAEIFWPELHNVMPEDFLTLVDEPRILLDFSLAMASLLGVYGILALFGGAWLWTNCLFWAILAMVAFTGSYFFYRVGVTAVNQYSALYRASFDLFRLELMYKLYRNHPPKLSVEREQWKQLSQLALYGYSQDFDLRPRADH